MAISSRFTIELSPPLEAEIDPEIIAEWIEERLNDSRNHFIRQMSSSRGGRTYKRGGKTHRASAPGQYPASDSGRLANSVDFQMNSQFEGQLQSDVAYAVFLTGGTSRMAPRKMLADAIEDVLKARPQNDQLARAATIRVAR